MALLNFFSLSKLKQHWYKVEIIEITTVKRSLAILNVLLQYAFAHSALKLKH